MALIFLVCLVTAGLGPILYSTKVLRDDPVKHGSSKVSIVDVPPGSLEEPTTHTTTSLASESPFHPSAGIDPTEEQTVTIEHFLQPSDLKSAERTAGNLNTITIQTQKSTPTISNSGVKTPFALYPVESTATTIEAPYNRSVARLSIARNLLKVLQSSVLVLAGVLIGISCSHCNILLLWRRIWRDRELFEGRGVKGRVLDVDVDHPGGLEACPLLNTPALSGPSLVNSRSDHLLRDAVVVSSGYCEHEATRGMYTGDDDICCQDMKARSPLTLSASYKSGDLKLDLPDLSGVRCAGSIETLKEGSDNGHVDEGRDITVQCDNGTYLEEPDKEHAPSDASTLTDDGYDEYFVIHSVGEPSDLLERRIQDGSTVNETTSLSSISSVVGNYDGAVLDVDKGVAENPTAEDMSEILSDSLYIPPHKRATAPLPESSRLESGSLSKTRQSQYEFYKTFLEGFRPGQGPSMLINDMLSSDTHGGRTVDGDLRRHRQSKSFLLGKWMAPRLVADRLHRTIRENKDTTAYGQPATQDAVDAGVIDAGVTGSSSDVGPGGVSAKGSELGLNNSPDKRKRILETDDGSQCKVPKGRKKRKSNAASPQRAPPRVLLLREDSKARMRVSSEEDACTETGEADVTIRASDLRGCTRAVEGINATDESGDFGTCERKAPA